MPKRTDIKKILIIGSGPIVIGQACEFDYSGTQACKALREEGFTVVLVNSNPATIMTDPKTADRIYIEPITPEFVTKIIAQERPDALLPTLGGQTGLNVAMKLGEQGVLEKYHVEMIGADREAIQKAEDRHAFKKAMDSIGLETPRDGVARSVDEAKKIAHDIGFPVVVRPSYTLGGTGGGFAFNDEELARVASLGLANSMIHEVLIEESIVGWKEYELEVMRDRLDNVVIICSIENLDPMGIHTGDSITVAPIQTLTDVEYQKMRDASIAIIREIGVETGGSNVQFAVNPKDGQMVVIEMNPRVSRSSALASKATGFPIAKIAAKLAVGYTLNELSNDITRETPACFEPTIDYCVVKIPRFTFEKFPEADPTLGVSMKSVGETMAIGRTFKEALQKGLRGLEVRKNGLESPYPNPKSMDEIREKLKVPNAERIFYIKSALLEKMSVEEIYALSKIDPWFLNNIKDIVDFESAIIDKKIKGIRNLNDSLLRQAKEMGFSDHQLSRMVEDDEMSVRKYRKSKNITPVYKLVDTCAAEFEAYTPYFYSTYEQEDESRVTDVKKVLILGGGPNRIGQGIEFDYCCCHASYALKELNIQSIMVNSNPETVSTDYDTSDKLFFEPLTFEDVMNIIDLEKPDGVIVQFGGQTPLNLARRLEESGAKIIGTSVESIERAENREKFAKLVDKLKLKQPLNGSAMTKEEAKKIANKIGYPVLTRPSNVLGGRAMRIAYNEDTLEGFLDEAIEASPETPVLIDKFLEGAAEVDVDAISDGHHVVIGGIMEHIEYAGVHSGDSACVTPPHTLSETVKGAIRDQTKRIASELSVKGLLNIQFAIKDETVYVLEVNPRASRTVPFISKATGVPLAALAAKVMMGCSLKDLGFTEEKTVKHFSVKESVLPFSRFAGVDITLGPEMKSTGEVMGIDSSFGVAFIKSQFAAGQDLPKEGNVFVSVKDSDKPFVVDIAKVLVKLGYNVIATKGTYETLKNEDISCERVNKIGEGPNDILERILGGEIHLVINTPSGPKSQMDVRPIMSGAVMRGIPCITTLQGAKAAVHGLKFLKTDDLQVKCIQDWVDQDIKPLVKTS